MGATADSTGAWQHLTFESAKTTTGGLTAKTETRGLHRNKLVDIGQRFVGFDKVIEEDTVKRKEIEVQKVMAAQEGLMKLEKALNCEIRRRVDANKQVQALAEQLANDMLERLQTNILARVEKLAASIESLTLRCQALEKGIAQLRGELPNKLQVDKEALVKEISEMRRQMEQDRKTRIERDTVLLRRLAEMEAGEAAQFEHDTAKLTTDVEDVMAHMDIGNAHQTAEQNRTEKFRGFILEEIAGMKKTLGVSCQAREQTDDEIVQAMNQYTHALEKGLHAANVRG